MDEICSRLRATVPINRLPQFHLRAKKTLSKKKMQTAEFFALSKTFPYFHIINIYMERRPLYPDKTRVCSKCHGRGFYVDKRKKPRSLEVRAKIVATKAKRKDMPDTRYAIDNCQCAAAPPIKDNQEQDGLAVKRQGIPRD